MELLERSASMTGHDEPAWERTRLRVPRENGTFFSEPAANVITQQIDHPHEWSESLRDTPGPILNRSLSDFRDQARSEVLEAAAQWTSGLTGCSIDIASTSPLIMTGHQPELFHPGVFAKNFATSLLASRADGVGLNLVVDNDLMASTRIHVPVGDRHRPGLSTVEFDTPRAPIPWEEAHVMDFDLLSSFADRVAGAMQSWSIEPLVTKCWPHVVTRAGQRLAETGKASLSECLTAGRVFLEREWSQGNLELPISRLCETDAFGSFAAHVLLNAEEFRRVYNQVLDEYRRVHRIRSSSHPVPELQRENGWCETPFWIWQVDDPRRGRLFVRHSVDGLELATSPDQGAIVSCLAFSRDATCEEASSAIARLQRAGVRLRTRALTTTLFSRICLCDLFVHGIGGAKYDTMTDRIATRFFGVKLPDYLTLSATIWLPLGQPHAVTPGDLSLLQQMLRELQQNPQRYVGRDLSVDAQRLVDEKLELIAEQQMSGAAVASAETSRQGRKRYRRFPEINRALARETIDQQNSLRDELRATEQRLAANRILTSREFSFCLYPADTMWSMVERLESHLLPTDRPPSGPW